MTGSPPTVSALEVRDLVKVYGDVRAVDGVSFTVAPGEAVALLGPNGSGKTTTLKAAAGLVKPDSGAIRVGGFDLGKHPRRARREMSFLPQQASFPANVTVREVLELHARLRRLPEDRVVAALAVGGLTEVDAGRFVGELSGGMRQRLSLAVAALPEAPLVLLDEPTANLDPPAALRFRRLARGWRQAGRSLLLSTHVLDDVWDLADRVVVLVEGRTVTEGTLAELRARLRPYTLLRVDVGEPNEAHERAALEGGATGVRSNSHSVIIQAPVERRYEILSRLARVGPVHHFETEDASIEHLYVGQARGGA